MPWRLLADGVVVVHLTVVGFVVFGGLLALRRPRAALVHLPFAAWGVAIEIFQWTCPLTPLENRLRQLAGDAGYEGGFVQHYVLPILYPDGLTAGTGLVLAALVLLVNGAIYAAVVHRRRRCPMVAMTGSARCSR